MTRILYVTWDAPEATYLEGLFVPAFERLAGRGYSFDVLQFGWGDSARARQACETAGVGYRRAPVDRRWGGAGPLKSALLGGMAVRDAARAFGSDWIMPRSLFAGIAALAAGSSHPMLFECDGFAADERAEHGGWGHGLRYHGLRAIERRLARRAAVSTVRTGAGRAELAHRADIARDRIFPVTNGRDAALFLPLDEARRMASRSALGVGPDELVLVHAGSVGPQYQLARLDPLFAALAARGAKPRLLLLSGDPPAARKAMETVAPVAARDAVVQSVPASQVGAWIALADAGLAYRAPSPSMRAVAPVKLAEYLLCGLPVIGSTIAGDPAEAAAADLLFDQERGAEASADWLLAKHAERDRTSEAAVSLGRERYSLERMVADYAVAMASMADRVA